VNRVKRIDKTQAKKKQILQQALVCFVEHGVQNTSIQMLCEVTNTSVGSLYHHFGNKDAIAARVYVEGMKDFSRLVNQYLQNLQQPDSAESIIKNLVYANVDWISKNKEWTQYLFNNRFVMKSSSEKETLAKNSEEFFKQLKEKISIHIQSGELKDLPENIYHAFISGPVHEYARHYLAGRYRKPIKRYREEFAESAWQALRKN